MKTQRFGIEVEMTGITRAAAARVIAGYFQTTATHTGGVYDKLYATGVIEDYALQFKGNPHSAFATIAPMKGAQVPVAVWEIQPLDELSLDRYEGVPTHYFKQNIPVLIGDTPMSAMVYIMNPKMDFGIPSQYYYKTVLQGYMDCGLDVDVLNQAVIDSSQKFYSNEASDMKLLDNETENEGEDIDESDGISLRPM